MKLERYSKKLFSAVSRKGLWLRPLGELERGKYIWLVSKRNTNGDKPNLLIAGGFHGEEIAGPWSILKWIEVCDTKTFVDVNISLLPVVNPTGFDKYKRKNKWDERTNCGFYHPEKRDGLSREGQILLENSETLFELGKDGFLSLHEDVNTDKFYIYTFENSTLPGIFSISLRDEEEKFFDRLKDGEKVNNNGEPDTYVQDGIVYKLCDGSFEDFLWHKGVPRTATIEIPGKFPLHRRVKAGVSLIFKFIEVSKELASKREGWR